MKRQYPWILAACAAGVWAISCGGGDGETPTQPGNPPLAVATATPSPAPSSTPDPNSWKNDEYYRSLADGPVVRVVCKIRSVHDVDNRNVVYTPPAVQIENGSWLIPRDRYVVLDSDAFNGSDRKCKNDTLPIWDWDVDPDAVELIGGSQPFLYKLITKRAGASATFWVTMDGIRSPALVLRIE